MEIVTFDDEAALTLASFPRRVFKRELTDGGSVSKTVVKYDAMILATAMRHRAEMLLCNDARMMSLAIEVGLQAKRPLDIPHQLELLEDEAATAAASGSE